MESLLLEISAFFASIPVRIVKARRLVLGTTIALTLFFIYGIATLTRFDMTTDSFLDAEDPAIRGVFFAFNGAKSGSNRCGQLG